MKYRIYYFDSYGISLHKLQGGKSKEFNSIEDAKFYLSIRGDSPKWLYNISKKKQLIIVGNDGKGWKIIEIIEPDEKKGI